MDRVLPMGLRSAAYICQRLTNAVVFVYCQDGWSAVNYLDDFGGTEGWDKAEEAFQALIDVIKACGLEESVPKAGAPSTCMVFLGVNFDTINMTLSVTKDRMVEIDSLLQVWEGKSSATKQEVQSLVGKLNFVAKCVHPGRNFIARMLQFLRSLSSSRKSKHCIPVEFKKDVNWWTIFLPKYNGVSMMAIEDWSSPDEIFATDACLVGGGGWCHGMYFHTSFPEFIIQQGLHINALYLLSHCRCKVMGPSMEGKTHCDIL